MLIEGVVWLMVGSGRGEGCAETKSKEGQGNSLWEALCAEGRQISANTLPCNYSNKSLRNFQVVRYL